MASFTMTTFLCVAVLIGITLVSGASIPFCQGTCPSGWHSNIGRCFKYVATKTHWADAERKCQNLGGHLPSVHSQEEDQFLKTLFKSLTNRDDPFWLGLSDGEMEGWWFWSDGSKVDYTRWNRNEPNNHDHKEQCVHSNWGSQKNWNDIPCDHSYEFICEQADPGFA